MNYRSVVVRRERRPRSPTRGEARGASTGSSSTSHRGASRACGRRTRRAARHPVVALPLDEASAKVRTGPPKDDEEDYALPVWAGEIPLPLQPGTAGGRSPPRAGHRGAARGPALAAAASLVLLALLATLLSAQPARPFADERVLLDRRLETLRRILPDGPTSAADVLLVRDLAETARLARVEMKPRPPVESGTRGDVVLDLEALAGYEEIDRFFQKVAVSHRLVDVESLTLTATGENVIQLEAVLRFPLLAGARASPAASRVEGTPHRRAPPHARRIPARPVSRLREVGRDRGAASRAAKPAPVSLGGRRGGARAARGARLRLARRGLHLARARGRRGAGARLRAPPGARLPARVGVPHGEAGRLLPLRGARQEPVRGAGRRAAGAGGRPVRPGPAALPRRPRRGPGHRGQGPHPHREGPRPGPADPAPARRRLRRRLPGADRARQRRLRGPGERRGARQRRGDARHPRRDARRHPQGVGRGDLRARAPSASSRRRVSPPGARRPRAVRRRASP